MNPMRRALALAANGLYTASPNPRVGCVIVAANGVIAGEGWHRKSGENHAEINALHQAGDAARDAAVFVTMEPCSHRDKKTPPCVDALIAAKVGRVIAATADPNPAVDGFAALRAAGIAVECGMLADEARELNRGYISRMTRKRPWLRLKIAATLDGKTALANGLSEWISGEEARRDAHHLRARSCAVLCGVGTALQDNPRLTVRRVATSRPPLRVLVDSRLRVRHHNKKLHLLQKSEDGAQTLIAAALPEEEFNAAAADFPAGVEALNFPPANGGDSDDNKKVDLRLLLAALAARGINEVTAEAGARLCGAFAAAGLADEIVVYTAGKIFGANARSCFDFMNAPPPPTPDDAPRFVLHSLERIGGDIKAVWRAPDCDSG
jgi:diaminohydroxyphosphoribosylaminopyrimidine deaminase/5-amino-6-(5-phosphoribosylamino)uracil reductase